jgi:hypothetical protein
LLKIISPPTNICRFILEMLPETHNVLHVMCSHTNITFYENLFTTCFVVISKQEVPWLRRLEAVFSSRRPSFDANSVTSFFEYLKFCPAVIISVTLYNYSCIYNRRYISLATLKNTLQSCKKVDRQV